MFPLGGKKGGGVGRAGKVYLKEVRENIIATRETRSRRVMGACRGVGGKSIGLFKPLERGGERKRGGNYYFLYRSIKNRRRDVDATLRPIENTRKWSRSALNF